MDNIMYDLMEYLMYKLKSRNMPIDEFRMQKLIFKVKMELGENHELYDKLPFYWFLKGPYSDVVNESFNIISSKCSSDNGLLLYKESYFNKFNIDEALILKYPEIDKISDNIINDEYFFYNFLDKEIYQKYAPYKFMYSYKYEIYDFVVDLDTVDFNVNEFINKISHCEGNLPFESYFYEFCTLFSKLSLFLDLIYNAGNFEKFWIISKKIIIFTWETFAKGVRVKFCDEYYKNNLNSWKMEFKENLSILNDFINELGNHIDYNDYSGEYDDEIKLLNATIGAYLRG